MGKHTEKRELFQGGVYVISCRITGKKYIGSAVHISARWGQHKYYLCKNDHENYYLQQDWDKYGKEAFDVDLLEAIADPRVRNEREQYWLEQFSPDHLYNIHHDIDSPQGVRRRPETRAKMSQAQRARSARESSEVKHQRALKRKRPQGPRVKEPPLNLEHLRWMVESLQRPLPLPENKTVPEFNRPQLRLPWLRNK